MHEIEVPPEGDINSKIAIVGEAPATEELVERRPFVGRAGKTFNNLLVHARVRRCDLYITNVFKFRVFKKGQDIFKDGRLLFKDKTKTFTLEGMQSVRDLIEELKRVKANVVVPMGNPALSAITDKKGITKWRNSMLWSEEIDRKIIPTLHPAAIMRNYLQRYWFIWDFKRINEEKEFPELRLPKRHTIISPSFTEAMHTLEEYSKQPILGFDIEVINEQVSCFSFAKAWNEAICIPFTKGKDPFYNLIQERELWDLTARILENPNIAKVGQNLDFDAGFLYIKYGIVMKNLEDTMLAHKIVFPDYPKGLAFITSTRTREPYYKDEGKIHMEMQVSNEQFWEYNNKDSMVCVEVLPSLKKDLIRLGDEETYEVHKKLIEPCIYMGTKGFKVDLEALEKVKKETKESISELQEKLNSTVGAELNVNSHKQLTTYFYVNKGLKPYKNKGKITCDQIALKRIARKGFEEAKLVLDIRKNRHTLSTYYNVKFKGGRLVGSYMPITKMGRLAAKKDIFGYGTNMQNQPKKAMNRFFVADEGYLLGKVDLSQADNRSVAYIGPVIKMMEAFEKEIDIHSLTASMIFEIPVDEIIDMNKKGIYCDIGYGEDTHRDWGKRCNHAFNFGWGPEAFSRKAEISVAEGKFLRNKYHHVYPGVQKRYQAGIKNQLSQNRILMNSYGRVYRFVERWGDKLFRQAFAFPAQSNTADTINRLGLIPLYYDRENYQLVELLRQLHDEIDFQIPLSAGIDYFISVLRTLKKSLETPLNWKARSFILPAEFEVGFRMSELAKLDFEGDLKEQLRPFWEGSNVSSR